MLAKFIKLYDIRPLTKKGEEYFTSDFRFASHIAEYDIYPSIEKHLEGLEEILLEKYHDFKIVKTSSGYSYSLPNFSSSEFMDTRINALLYVFNFINEEERNDLIFPVQNLLYGKHRDFYYQGDLDGQK